MRLRSTGFSDGAVIPRPFTCDGEDIPPPLEWSGAPAETRSFVVLCDDPDAPAGKWHHWAVYDIPAEQTELTAQVSTASQHPKEAINDFHRPGYGGPCPPRHHGVHHYHFRLLALSVDKLPLRTSRPTCSEVEREARKHLIAEAILIGLYQR